MRLFTALRSEFTSDRSKQLAVRYRNAISNSIPNDRLRARFTRRAEQKVPPTCASERTQCAARPSRFVLSPHCRKAGCSNETEQMKAQFTILWRMSKIISEGRNFLNVGLIVFVSFSSRPAMHKKSRFTPERVHFGVQRSCAEGFSLPDLWFGFCAPAP
jgi:hypothetical protein